jgi:hypothetical protein
MKFTLNLLSETELSIELEDKLFEKFTDPFLFSIDGLICVELDEESVEQAIADLKKIGIEAKQVTI